MTIRIGTGMSSENNAYFAGKNAATKALSSLGVDVPELGLAFSHYEYPILQVYDGIKATLGDKNLVIINSKGNILGDTIKKKSVILSLFSGHSCHCAVSLINNMSLNPYISGHHLAWGMLDVLGKKTESKEIIKKIAIVFASNSSYQKSELLKGLQEVLGVRFPIIGGVISGETNMDTGSITFNREGSSDSIVGILFGDEKLIVGTGCYHGWIPLGLTKRVKKVEKNRIQDLENISPLKYYSQYLGEHINLAKGDIRSISTLYPLGLELEKDQYLIRFPKSFDPGGSIIIDSQIAENQLLRLMMGTRKELLNASEMALKEALKPLEEGKTIPSLIIITSAIERKEVLGIDIHQEISQIRKKIPETTKIIGLYTDGQFGPYGGSSDLSPSLYHNGAIAITAIGIKKV